MSSKPGLSATIKKRLLVLLPEEYLPAVKHLKTSYQKSSITCTLKTYKGELDDTVIPEKLNRYDAVLLIGSNRRSPSTVLKAPFLVAGKGKKIPVGWLPVKNEDDITNFSHTVEKVHARKKVKVATALLAQRHPRFIKVASRMESLLEGSAHAKIFKWTSDLMIPESMAEGLRTGLGCAIYMGHGRPSGWVGYYGTRIHHLTEIEGEPLGALLSLCCETASRKRIGLSFTEAVSVKGVAAASFGAVRKTLHTDNTRWAIRICDSLLKGVDCIGDLIVDACPPGESAWKHYRLVGDPLAPLFPHNRALALARKVKVYL